jgi:hypothetical protein
MMTCGLVDIYIGRGAQYNGNGIGLKFERAWVRFPPPSHLVSVHMCSP